MASLLLINGPNLGLLGQREPNLYGANTLSEIETQLTDLAKERKHELKCFQSDAEHELVKRIHDVTNEEVELILFNPAAFTHTSIVLRDALLAVKVPFIEIHLSNVAAREDFRKHSYFSDIAVGTISGFGVTSYELALIAAEKFLE
ncbi:MAG: type II 3-dehydroquinate dehydratase [Rhodospirillaceae bacterium]|nr:type II 3-dehydroquinate dehydratase [Rhodospirillaceae bacterium]|tara:strand:+ start:1532 stop:1969 length:438 start_codon:yes stop_codon:yes gene_type:complete